MEQNCTPASLKALRLPKKAGCKLQEEKGGEKRLSFERQPVVFQFFHQGRKMMCSVQLWAGPFGGCFTCLSCLFLKLFSKISAKILLLPKKKKKPSQRIKKFTALKQQSCFTKTAHFSVCFLHLMSHKNLYIFRDCWDVCNL